MVATSGFIKTDAELDNLTGIGTGVMLFANIPIMLLLRPPGHARVQNYMQRLDGGQMEAGHAHRAWKT